ncbi:hypothetical protein BCU30_021410 [Vibrio lentus]|uniref:hypothetical protein n=1 Tax=Vibrio lentus TaxID=136468 RepID=UPI000C8368CC|nr:hypothetical protein [Vibrio lentus]PMJ11424.1 hypothetical protein BCU30_07090 [Vibrio lentus]PMN49133.1 hypothetical protein BCT31_23230 [Vibrio lentus]
MSFILFLALGIVIGYFLRGYALKKVDDDRRLPDSLSESESESSKFYLNRAKLELKNRNRTQTIREKNSANSAAFSVCEREKKNTTINCAQDNAATTQKPASSATSFQSPQQHVPVRSKTPEQIDTFDKKESKSEFYSSRAKLELKNRNRTQAIRDKISSNSASFSVGEREKKTTTINRERDNTPTTQQPVNSAASLQVPRKQHIRMCSNTLEQIDINEKKESERRLKNHRNRALLKAKKISSETLLQKAEESAPIYKKQDFSFQASKGEFVIKCNHAIFSEVELEILYCYGVWLSELTSGKVDPDSNEQVKFVLECKAFRQLNFGEMSKFIKENQEFNVVQVVWLKYIARLKYEATSKTHTEKVWDWGWQGAPIESGSSKFFS